MPNPMNRNHPEASEPFRRPRGRPRKIKDESESIEPLPDFPFDKMPYQNDDDEQLKDYEKDEVNPSELDIGESDKRIERKRTLADERDAGYER